MMEPVAVEYPVDWLHLPTEIWLYILSFLPKRNFPRLQLYLTCSYLYAIVLTIPSSNQLKIFQNHLKHIERYDKEDMSSLKELVRKDNKIELDELYFLELLSKWVTVTQPKGDDLEKVWELLGQHKLCYELVNDVRYYIASVIEFTEYVPYVHHYASSAWEYQNYYFPLQSHDIDHLLSKSFIRLGCNIARISDTNQCKVKSCDLYTVLAYQLELKGNHYIVRDLIPGECDVTEHCHVNTVLHAWIGCVGVDALYLYASLLSLSKAEVDDVLRKEGGHGFTIYVMCDPNHSDN